MNIDIYHQVYDLFIFFIIGIIIGILFDLFRIIRKSFKTPDIITYVEDIIFFILVGCILLFSIFTFNNGEIRSYIFIGLFAGLIIYLLTISKYFIKISVIILNFIKKIIYLPIKTFCNFINKIIILPIKSLIEKLKNFIEKKNKNISKNVINDENIDNYDKIEQ